MKADIYHVPIIIGQNDPSNPYIESTTVLSDTSQYVNVN